MVIALKNFTIKIDSALITPSSSNYRLPSWPPPRDWPVVLDQDGVVISRWGDRKWDLSLWAKKSTVINFGDGKGEGYDRAVELDSENAYLLRMVATWVIWGPNPVGVAKTVVNKISRVRQIIALCSRNGISAANLMRFPKIISQVPAIIAPSQYKSTLGFLQRLYDARELLGFAILAPNHLHRVAEVDPGHDGVQTPYIPSRIWLYQNRRLHECISEYLKHRAQIKACFDFCLEAYVNNYGSLKAALAPKKQTAKAPFNAKSKTFSNLTYCGKFSITAAEFGISELLSKWVGCAPDEIQIKALATYFSLVSYASLAYISNFTMQRINEALSLRADCLVWENDPELGRVPMICGETTKTQQDSDARWIASPSVASAVEAASSIAHMRMICDKANARISPTEEDQNNPYLLSTATEPWGRAVGSPRPYSVRPNIMYLSDAMHTSYTQMFDHEELRITHEDLEEALKLTPNLPAAEFFVGKIWPLAWHQYRRTTCVNMLDSGDISDTSVQYQMKHASRLMPHYYGRNHGRLRLNQEVKSEVVTAMYEAQVEMIKRAAIDERFISPHQNGQRERLNVNILSTKDTAELTKLAKTGVIAFREHRLGGCMKAGVCDYGGIESVARCAGGDGAKACIDVLYDRTKEPQIRADIVRLKGEIELLDRSQPRYKALVEERTAMENYLNVIAAN